MLPKSKLFWNRQTFDEANEVGFDAVFFVVVISSFRSGEPNKSVKTLDTGGGVGFGGSGFDSCLVDSVDSEDLGCLLIPLLFSTFPWSAPLPAMTCGESRKREENKLINKNAKNNCVALHLSLF